MPYEFELLKDGERVNINDVDKEVADITGMKQDEEMYMTPFVALMLTGRHYASDMYERNKKDYDTVVWNESFETWLKNETEYTEKFIKLAEKVFSKYTLHVLRLC